MKYFYLATFALLCMLTTQLSAQTTYLWSTGATTPTISVNPTVTTTYYVTITHNGVAYLDSLLVQVNPAPTITGQNTVCSGGSTQLTGSGTPAALNPWVSSNTNVATISETGLLSGVSVGSATITYTNSGGCEQTLEITVTQGATGVDVINSCGPIIWIDGNTYASSNSTATHLLVGAAQNGCDSLVTLNLTVTPMPDMPTLACYETAEFNITTCVWEISGTQPTQPTGLACWQTTTFNTATCGWDIVGTQPQAPTGFACYQTAVFNQNICDWEVIGTQPAQPTLACYETASFNNTTCSWEVSGAQPAQPTLACYETASFNTTTCSWVVSGTQPVQPTLACYETASFNTTTCSWDIFGTQPNQPTLACYETASFNTTTCSWDIFGTQPNQPTLACYETANFNTTTCQWEVSGTQPTQPTVNCFQTATFNPSTCQWVVTGSQPVGNAVIGSCGPITWIDGNTYATSNYTATHLLVGASQNGCDSLVTLKLTITPCTQLHPADCNITQLPINVTIRASAVTGALIYRFRINGPNDGSAGWVNNVYILDRNTRAMKFDLIPGIVFGSTYTIDVAVSLNGVNFGGFGNTCTVGLQGAAITQIMQSYCGLTNADPTTELLANPMNGAVSYRFRFTGVNTGATGWSNNVYVVDRPIYSCKLSLIPGLVWGETYLVDVAVLGQNELSYGPYGSACPITYYSLTTEMEAINCNVSNVAFSTVVRANAVSGATGYRFKITGNNTGAPGWNGNAYILDRPTRDFRFNMIPGVLWAESYNVEVAILNQTGTLYGPYANSCTLSTNFPSTNLDAASCNFSGATLLTTLRAVSNTLATGYRFRITGNNTGAPGWNGNVLIYDSPVRSFKFNMFPGVIAGQTYQIEVALLRQNGMGYGPFGQTCTVTLSNVLMPGLAPNDTASEDLLFEVDASHNPFTTHFKLKVLTNQEYEPISITIHDMSGKLLESQTTYPLDIDAIQFGNTLTSGMYLVQVQQGSQRHIIRQIKN